MHGPVHWPRHSPLAAAVTSLTPCRLLVLGRAVFLGCLAGAPEMLAAVLARLTATVRGSTQRRLEAEARQRGLRAQLELERYRSLAHMVAGVAHELNTPLGIANTAASVLENRVTSDELRALAGDPRTRVTFDDLQQAANLVQASIAQDCCIP